MLSLSTSATVGRAEQQESSHWMQNLMASESDLYFIYFAVRTYNNNFLTYAPMYVIGLGRIILPIPLIYF